MAVSDEIFDITIWEGISRTIAPANVAFGFIQKAKSLAAQEKVNNFILRDEIIQLTTGETEKEYFARIAAEKQEQIETNRIAHEETSIRIAERETEIINESRELQRQLNEEHFDEQARKRREEDIKARNEDSRFWAREKELEREREAADRKAIADFWIEYFKTKQKMADNNRPSNLNFGLLR